MCGRYILLNGRKLFATTEFLEQLERDHVSYLDVPRYNVAPGTRAPIIFQRNDALVLVEALWWLVPSWSKTGTPDVKFPSFNARAETIETSKLYGPYFKSQRCLVPADGFYEWQRISSKEKIPMCIRMQNDERMYFGGVYSLWNDAQGNEHPSFSILTTTPNELMSTIHARMPVLLAEHDLEQWLDPSWKDSTSLKKMLAPFPDGKLYAYRVSSYVNNARNEGEECMKPAEDT